MANMSKLFPSKYLSAGDLNGKPQTVTILGGEFVELDGQDGKPPEQKWIVHTAEFDKGWMLNLTNGKLIANIHGDDTDEWIDQQVVLIPTTTDFGGKRVECIRVDAKATSDMMRRKLKAMNAPAATAAPARPKPQPVTQAEADAGDDDIDLPF